MTLGEFVKWLSICGYPNRGERLSGGGVGLKAAGVLAQSAAASSVTGTTAETILASVAIPAGYLGPNGTLRVTTLWSFPNSANTKTIRVRLGGQIFSIKALTTSLSFQGQTIIRARGTRAQVSSAPSAASDFGSSGAVVQMGTVDMTQDQTLTITGTLASSTETITHEGYIVEVLNP